MITPSPQKVLNVQLTKSKPLVLVFFPDFCQVDINVQFTK